MVHISYWFMLMMLIIGKEHTYYKGKRETLIVASKETGLEINTDTT